jgi:hypothetical protein
VVAEANVIGTNENVWHEFVAKVGAEICILYRFNLKTF